VWSWLAVGGGHSGEKKVRMSASLAGKLTCPLWREENVCVHSRIDNTTKKKGVEIGGEKPFAFRILDHVGSGRDGRRQVKMPYLREGTPCLLVRKTSFEAREHQRTLRG